MAWYMYVWGGASTLALIAVVLVCLGGLEEWLRRKKRDEDGVSTQRLRDRIKQLEEHNERLERVNNEVIKVNNRFGRISP